MQNFRFRHQPLRSFYQIYHAATLLGRFPVWLLKGLIPFLRPRPSWSLAKVIQRNFMLFAVESLFQTGMPVIDSSPSKTSMVAGYADVDPIPATLIAGDIEKMAAANHVVPARVWGYWHDGKTKASHTIKIAADEKVVLFLHAGGFVMGSAAPDALFTPVLCDALSRHGRVFALEYRLASEHPFPAANPFPAAILDAIAGYQYLLSKGVTPTNIIVCGESAGSVLALSLVRYLIMNTFSSMPPPGGVLLFSPSADWGPADWSGSLKRNASTDYSMPFYNGYSGRAATGNLPVAQAATNSWISPASSALVTDSGLFKGFPKTCIVAGEGECVLDAIHRLRDRLENDVGDDLTYIEIYGATHCFCSMPVFEPERTEGLEAAGAWISSL